VIVDVGERMAVPSYGQVIAIAVALQESDLRDLDYGDADSLGLFQQRPSQGWGSPAQILNTDYAATAFYHHLMAVPGWESMALTQAAQAVQQSAFPAAYARWQGEATSLVQQFAAGTIRGGLPHPVRLTPIPPAPLVTSPSSASSPAPALGGDGTICGIVALPAGSVGQVLGFAAAQVGKSYVLGATGPDAWDCSALVQAAYATAGVDLPRTADEQYDYARAYGQVFAGPASAAGLRPGDLLFSPGDDPVPAADGQPIGHVGIYAGNGVVIEAKGARWGVISTTYTAADFGDVTFVGRLVAQRLPTQAPATSQTTTSSSPGAIPSSAKGIR
jgi:cell wall-associated NlpC family hydrolase